MAEFHVEIDAKIFTVEYSWPAEDEPSLRLAVTKTLDELLSSIDMKIEIRDFVNIYRVDKEE